MPDKKVKVNPNPLDTAAICSRLTGAWLFPFFAKGYRRTIEERDLFDVQKEDSSVDLGDLVSKNWENEVAAAKKIGRKASYIRVLFKSFGPLYFLAGIIVFIEDCILKIGQPLCLGGLIRYFHNEPGYSEDYLGVLFALGIALGSFFYIGTHHSFYWIIQHTGMKLHIASCSLLYRKALRLSKTALRQTTVGQMVNLLSNDVNRFDMCVIFLHYLWIGPLQTFLVTIVLWQYLGPSCFAGILLLILLVPLQSYMGRVFSQLRLATAHRTDERVRRMDEIINAMRVIKLFAWEKPFTALIKEARRKEISIIMKTNCYVALKMSIYFTSSKIIIFLALLVYVLTGNILTAEKVFVSSSLINHLRYTMALMFPLGVSTCSETFISCKRIQEFIEMEEIEDSNRVDKPDIRPEPKNCYVEVDRMYASWIPASGNEELKDISFCAKASQLTAIIGPVGSGKSSFLYSLLSELPIRQGSIKIQGRVAYVSQEAWLLAGTIKQNVLFGQPYESKKYHEVIRVCALERDLDDLPDGDETLVGERGAALSGGQKARINLARAVYYEADIYLLDDPLSAVDTDVGRHLYEQCITKYLAHKVCILATHQIQFLRTADNILILNNGRIEAQGTYAQLSEQGVDFTSAVGKNEGKKREENVALKEPPESSFELEEAGSRDHGQIVLNSIQSNSLHETGVKDAGGITIKTAIENAESLKNKVPLQRKMTQPQNEEIKSTGTVSMSTYGNYFKAGGGAVFLSALASFSVITQVLFTGSDFWLYYWTNHERIIGSTNLSTNEESITISANQSMNSSLLFSRDTYVYVYTGMTIGLFLMSLFQTVMFFMLCLVASRHLHLRMFSAIIQAPIKFFDTHPNGQILNRFTKDLGQMDDLLPPTIFDFISIILTFFGIVAIVSYLNVWILLPTVFLAVVFFLLRSIYLRSARDVKRLEGITRSPVFSHLSSSLQGLTTIRALRAQGAFIKQFDDHQDLHTSTYFLMLSTTRCFAIWLDVLACIFVSVVTFSFFLKNDDEVNGGVVGLAISSAIMLSGMFQWGVRQSAEVENQMTSVERVLEYSKLEPESPRNNRKENKKPDWPNCGTVSFQDVSLQYDPDDPPVLTNINFTIEGGHKVGVVGRTGAGKSSLLTCLFRLTQPGGKIMIDGVDTDSIHLGDLRESISIIPQDPTLFNGTVRDNLDPFSSHTDDEIWNALDEVELKSVVGDMTGGLSAFISEGGGNLSVGQRQLACLARAILRQNKILVMDEATANVDLQTDMKIQQTIRSKFADCTVLTIAHRLHTIMDSDKVMVMEAGKVVEFSSPFELLKDDRSMFYNLVQHTGPTAKHLLKIAEEVYFAGRDDNEQTNLFLNKDLDEKCIVNNDDASSPTDKKLEHGVCESNTERLSTNNTDSVITNVHSPIDGKCMMKGISNLAYEKDFEENK